MFERNLMDHIDESVRKVCGDKKSLYEESKKYWTDLPKSPDKPLTEDSSVDKVVKQLTQSGGDYKVIIEGLDNYMSQGGLTSNQKSILESAREKLTELIGE